MIFTVITFLTAITISLAAIYYSVTGLATIFAGAALSVMIMGTILETSKLVAVVWLHKYWSIAPWWLKSYLLMAVVTLMLITSMGIFGGLSKAHIEQTAIATESQQQIIRYEEDLNRLERTIERAEEEIKEAETRSTVISQDLQRQITLEQQRIDGALARVQPEIDRQLAIIERERQTSRVGLIEEQLRLIDERLNELQSAIDSNDIRTAQGIVGVSQDGILGPNTRTAIADFQSEQEAQKTELSAEIASLRGQTNPAIQTAEEEISRLRGLAEEEISNSNQLINRLRDQLGQDDSDRVASIVFEQEKIIDDSSDRIDAIRDDKFTLETELRLLEAEVGPVRYIAELIYGETTQDLLEKSVRWVILLLIFVFDPLAVLLLIASQYAYQFHRDNGKKKL
jgi:peptidoglycan hydrolase-like protein with peptidoglycan-binding domain